MTKFIEQRVAELEAELSKALDRLKRLEVVRANVQIDSDLSRCKAIQERVSVAFGYDMQSVFSRLRSDDLCKARHMIIYLSHRFTLLNSCRLGEIFQRDHTSILYAIKSAIERSEVDGQYKRQMEEWTEIFKQEFKCEPYPLNREPEAKLAA